MHEKHEVEYRALISRRTLDAFIAEGKSLAEARFEGPITIVDSYFCPKSVTSFTEIEMDSTGSYSLRLRSEKKGRKEIASINTKVIQSVGDHNAWLEHETGISSFAEVACIFSDIGFKNFFELRKKRYAFKDGEINVCLEDIENFQPAIEIEIITTRSDTDMAKKRLLSYMKNHHIEDNLILKKSVTNLLMQKLSHF